jgi:hypothetical protein
VIGNVTPPIISVVERGDVDEFASKAYWTVPPPTPLAPEVTRTQPSAAVALHEHPPPVSTTMLPVPCSGPTFAEVGFKL